jgi:DNA-binding MarR family transcriptional regulator
MTKSPVRSANRGADEEPRTPNGEALSLFILAVFKLNGRLARTGDALSRDLNLTSARWQVLGAISERPKTVAQIARHYELTRQGVLWVVQAMLKDGLVELIHNPDHRRAKLVQQTAAGQTLYREISRRQRRWVSELATPFDIATLEAGTALLGRLGDMLVPGAEESP